MKEKIKQNIYIIIPIIIVLIVITIIITTKDSKTTKDPTTPNQSPTLNLEDNSYIIDELKEDTYKILITNTDCKALSTKVEFNNYETKYIYVKVGENYQIPYKNTIKSILLKDIQSVDTKKIEEELKKHQQQVMEYLEYDEEIDPISEVERNLIEKVDNKKNRYENIKNGSIIYIIKLFNSNLFYEISYYKEDNNLIGELSYYIVNYNIENNKDNNDNNKEIIEKPGSVG